MEISASSTDYVLLFMNEEEVESLEVVLLRFVLFRFSLLDHLLRVFDPSVASTATSISLCKGRRNNHSAWRNTVAHRRDSSRSLKQPIPKTLRA
jgi:hypothetical protein